ncbi:C-C chemokine receptor type 8-like [Oryzias melastigma]|uniref:C-C chemokine receptor type 8-like n=1 Tax=Oryzias melastigma TaxID=30732 RepID=UPI000CF7E9A7|nr:C-C chemokine receptor type 8-like [Oryzias melastigma]
METTTSTVFTTNTSTSGHLLSSSWDITGLTRAALLSLSFLLGFSGNIAVILLKPNIQTLSPLSQSLMLNLAVSDLLCVLTLPFWIYDLLISWTLGLVACKLLTCLLFLSFFCSLLTVTLLSVQRYLVVVKQQHTLNHFGAKRLLVLLWIASLVASIPSGISHNLIEKENMTYCTLQFSSEALVIFVLIEEIIVGFVTIFILAFSYISLYRKLKRAAFFHNCQTTRLVSSITASFFVLNFPYHVINVLTVTAVSLHIEGLMEFCRSSRYIFGAILLFNISLNPLLYAFTSCNFWKCSEKLNCWARNSGVS